MNRRRMLKTLTALALCPLCGGMGLAAEGAHWSYGGEHGPDHWGDLDLASRICAAGHQQSPIAIESFVEAQLSPLQFSWARQADTIVNNGHTIQLNFNDGGMLTIGSERFSLVQFHFHHPSEHLINGKVFPMEVHFVHRKASGSLGVIGVLMTIGTTNPVFAKVVETMPHAAENTPVTADPAIDPNGLLPARHGYYRYSGSLTTPPCSETVDWMLLTDPVEVALTDVAAFAELYPWNARPPQRLDRRFVLHSA